MRNYQAPYEAGLRARDKCVLCSDPISTVLFCAVFLLCTGLKSFLTLPARERTEKAERRKNLTLLITDERNALERAMLHFAHFEKQAERTDDGRYILRLKYYENDETEIVIRVLSFGPYVKVLEPESFVNLIKERLISQKSCELK